MCEPCELGLLFPLLSDLLLLYPPLSWGVARLVAAIAISAWQTWHVPRSGSVLLYSEPDDEGKQAAGGLVVSCRPPLRSAPGNRGTFRGRALFHSAGLPRRCPR